MLSGEKFELPKEHIPRLSVNSEALLSGFSSYILSGLFSSVATLFACWCLLLVLCFQWPWYRAEVLSHVPKPRKNVRKSVMCLTEKMHVSDTLPLGMRHRAVAPKFM